MVIPVHKHEKHSQRTTEKYFKLTGKQYRPMPIQPQSTKIAYMYREYTDVRKFQESVQTDLFMSLKEQYGLNIIPVFARHTIH